MYTLSRSLLFRLPTETSHRLALSSLDLLFRLRLSGLLVDRKRLAEAKPVRMMGLEFPNGVGLAAGLDKDAEHIDALAALGFGSIEVGTLTPRPQPGNARPRLFRLPQQQAIINRMGFNNKGIDQALERIRGSRYRGVLGINIGKNADTPVAEAAGDYLTCMRKAYSAASYLVVNLSSPNTPGLRSLQYGQELRGLLSALKEEQVRLAAQHERQVPLVVKIAPDLNIDELGLVAEALLEFSIDGVIATNTTLSRDGVEDNPLHTQAGGLSGAPLRARSSAVIGQLYDCLGERLPIIGVGGIGSGEDACEKIRAGARAVQLYTGFIYRGPELVSEAVAALAALAEGTDDGA